MEEGKKDAYEKEENKKIQKSEHVKGVDLSKTNGNGNENTFKQTNITLEPYGKGDYRLLKYQNDRTCLFEETPNEINRNRSNLHQFTQVFYSAIEKMKQIENQENVHWKNAAKWNKIEELRILIESELKEFMVLFDFLLGTLNNDKGQPYMMLKNCAYPKDTEEAKQNLCIAVTSRKEMLEKLKTECEKTRKEINSVNGIMVHKYYLCFLHQLISNWKLMCKKYEEIDYIQADYNFPYISEVITEFYSLPAQCWNLSSTPIFLKWPPFPSFVPFKSQYAQITFSLKNLELPTVEEEEEENKEEESVNQQINQDKHKENGNNEFNKLYNNYANKKEEKVFQLLDNTGVIFMKFEGTCAHLIEKRYSMHLQLSPLNRKTKRKEKKNEGERKINFPEVEIPENITFEQAKKVHKTLTLAQWILIDKSIFCIIAEQIHTMKDKNNEITIILKNKKDKEKKKVTILCSKIEHDAIDFVIYNLSIPTKNKKSYQTVDFSFSFLYDSEQDQIKYTQERQEKDNVMINKKGEKEESEEESIDEELIELFLNLALAKIRDLFICSWKYFSFEVPYSSADIHHNIYNSLFPDIRAEPLILNFFKWFIVSIQNFLRINIT